MIFWIIDHLRKWPEADREKSAYDSIANYMQNICNTPFDWVLQVSDISTRIQIIRRN